MNSAWAGSATSRDLTQRRRVAETQRGVLERDQLVADGEDDGVDEGVAEPGGGEGVGFVVKPGPAGTADGDGEGEEPSERRSPAEVEAEDEDVVGGEAEATDG